MGSIAVIGEERNILGFKPFGVDVYLAGERPQGQGLEEWFSAIVNRKYSLIMITEPVAEQVREQLDSLWERDFPVVLTIQGAGPTGGFAPEGAGPAKGLAFQRLRKLVIKAIGTDLFKEET